MKGSLIIIAFFVLGIVVGLQSSTFNFQFSTFNFQFSIFNLQFSTFNLQFNKEIPAAITVSGFPVPPRC